jgi:hypothetical protein
MLNSPQLSIRDGNKLVILPRRIKHGKGETIGGLGTHEDSYVVLISGPESTERTEKPLLKACNPGKCTAFAGLSRAGSGGGVAWGGTGPWTFHTITKLYCMVAFGGTVESFTPTVQTAFKVQTAKAAGVDASHVDILSFKALTLTPAPT